MVAAQKDAGAGAVKIAALLCAADELEQK